jgi:hypothetical protein
VKPANFLVSHVSNICDDLIDTEAAKLEDHHMDDLVQATRLLVDERRKNMMYLRFDIVLELN